MSNFKIDSKLPGAKSKTYGIETTLLLKIIQTKQTNIWTGVSSEIFAIWDCPQKSYLKIFSFVTLPNFFPFCLKNVFRDTYPKGRL